MNEDLSNWADRIEAILAAPEAPRFNRVRVVATTASTQDAALAAAGPTAGLVVIAGRQTGGRGRLGRTWNDDHGLGIAMSFVLDAASTDHLLPLRAGLAACHACEATLQCPCAMRWPNDVVESAQQGRKLAGVLVEVRQGFAIVGIGINVLQSPADWSRDLAGRAVSLAELGPQPARIDVACSLLSAFEQSLAETPARVVDQWRNRDRLIGRRCRLRVGNRRIEGIVEGIDPAGALTIVHDDGRIEHVPAAVVSIEHEPQR